MLNTHYKKITTFLLSMVVFIGSIGFVYHKINNASAAITDCTTIGQNLITNCSFESPAVLPAGYTASNSGYPTFVAGYTGLTGWSMITPGTGNVTLVTGATGNAPQGDRVVDISGVIDPPATTGLNGEVFGSGIEQTVTGLTAGQSYTLSFYQSHLSAGSINFPSQVNVVVDGTSRGIFSHTPATAGTLINTYTWTKNSVSFVATSSSAVIRFLNNAPTPAPADGPGRPVDIIDNIVLTRTFSAIPILQLSTPLSVVSGSFNVTLCPSEPITGVDLGDFGVTNGTASSLSGPTLVPTTTCAGGEIYTVTVTPTAPGNIQINFAGSGITTFSGNPAASPLPLNVLYTLSSEYSNVHIQSNNPVNTSYATTGNTITLTYTLDSSATPDKITTSIDGVSVTPTCVASVLVVGGNDCTATLLVPAGAPIPEGLVTFNITNNAAGGTTTTMTTDFSSVTVDRVINVVINTPIIGDDLSTFLIGGQCEIGAGNVTISGSGFSPNPVTAPCDSFGYFEYDPVTGTPGTITVTATQTDHAGNVGTDTNIYTYTATPPTLPTITISGPLGNANTGSNTITGTCTVSAGNVTISGTGFTPSSGTASCTGAGPLGTYSFPITVTGNTAFTASQTNGAGTAIATGSTVVPTTTTSGGGGCLPGYSCFSNTPSSTPTTPPVTTNTAVTATTSTAVNRCPVFTQYLKKGMRDGKNGISEISKVQSFLNEKLGLNLFVDGIFGSRTHTAVRNFQSTYFDQVLTPWGLTGPTGWWYQSTRSYANYLENCSEGTVPLDNGVRVQDGRIVN